MDLTLQERRITLISMEDTHTKLKAGDRGTIQFQDDINQIHVQWDNGSTLAVIPGVDNYFIEPKYHFSNSPYSVEMINSLMTPWLITNMFSVDKTAVFAGTMLSEFIEIMEKFDTKVYTYEKEKD